MNTPRLSIRFILTGCVLLYRLALGAQTLAADASSPVPAIVQNGFGLWLRGGAPMALEAWEKGGLMEGDRKIGAECAYFKRLGPAIGGYKSYELITVQKISQASQLVYLSLNFDRAILYARFLLYRTEQDWVVQNMDFNVKPEAVIPWLAFAGSTPAE
jgi:hypothetical protein